MRILVVDDEPGMLSALSQALAGDGHEVHPASDGIAALGIARTTHVDLALVDVTMPGMSGFELTRHLRAHSAQLGIILLTARGDLDDRVRGFDAGADDYLTKPFAHAELRVRMRALARRGAAPTMPITVGDVIVDIDRRVVRVAERELVLSRTEFDVLRILAERSGDVVTRAEILDRVWGTEGTRSNVVDQYVGYVRRKLSAAGAATVIVTERGTGFRMDPSS